MRGAESFARLFRTGRRLDGPHVQVLMMPAAREVGCIGFVIGKKQLARAVDRNYVRRTLREVVRQRRPALDTVDIVLRLRRGCESSVLPQLAAEAGVLIDRLTADRGR